ncbi:MAG: hypothetical protein NZ739_09360 [Verrucomicrobiae bacterium]|nr:hypothetical protein [Verrucomicrobiae bacterium]MDW7979032.1 hypothetical protein [Verrucomicrobiales bacterium]
MELFQTRPWRRPRVWIPRLGPRLRPNSTYALLHSTAEPDGSVRLLAVPARSIRALGYPA